MFRAARETRKLKSFEDTLDAIEKMKAVVIGGTGAIGMEIVGQLLSSEKWSVVTTLGRREVNVPEAYPESEWKARLIQKTVNMDKMKEEGADAFVDADSVFCALGTTRAVAGSAENFRKVDLDYVKYSAELGKQAGATHYSLVTSQGANPNSFTSDLKIFHPFLYIKVKGQAEEAVKNMGFERVSIFRPGLLERGGKARGGEKVLAKVMSSVSVSSVARAMILDAQRNINVANPVKGAATFENAVIKESAKTGQPPPWPREGQGKDEL